ncbi:carbamate kinase [Bacillus testis]|uniref:carbamate kinase n=1 Tax=Bacillus testis TaxID=1622072 RepID=UPI00067EC6F7|nr:carbamate kinase [Bacillus testis]
MEQRKVVIALGGNAIQSGEATAEAQQAALADTANKLVPLIENGLNVLITHGNGPQVGNILLQQKAADSEKTPAMPLDTCGAMSQGMIGYWMQNAFETAFAEKKINKSVASVITQVVVDKNDPSFENPTKPIGPFYTKEEADEIAKENEYVFKEDANRGYRRVVPSPKPISIYEYPVIADILNNGHLVIAAGGGGIPVIANGTQLHGTEAVIDKDYAAEKLAELVDADILVILTAVENVYVNFGKPDQKKLEQVTVEQMEQYISENQFAPGSMLPKVEAGIAFAKSGKGRKTIITSLEHADEAVEGKTGTVIQL